MQSPPRRTAKDLFSHVVNEAINIFGYFDVLVKKINFMRIIRGIYGIIVKSQKRLLTRISQTLAKK